MEAIYDVERLERIYLHEDGGKWIKNGFENFTNVIRMINEFHFETMLKKATRRFPNRSLKRRIIEAITEKELEKFVEIFQSLEQAARGTRIWIL